MHPPSPSTLSKTFDADPAAKRFILTRYGFTGGLALLFCLSLVVLVTVRTQLTIRSRHQVVALVERGALRPNALGDIRLPRSLARASINGHVYLGSGGNGSGKGQSVIFFPTVSTTYYVDWEDGTPDQRKYQMEGYVYSPKPLPSYYGVGFSDSEIDDLVYLDHEQGTSHWYYGTPWESD